MPSKHDHGEAVVTVDGVGATFLMKMSYMLATEPRHRTAQLA